MTEDDFERRQSEISSKATRIGKNIMEFETHAGFHKKEVRRASYELMEACIFLEDYMSGELGRDKRTTIEDLSRILDVEWIEDPILSDLYVGMDIYDYGPNKWMVNATEEGKEKGKYFFEKVVRPILKKHKITEEELGKFVDAEDDAIREERKKILDEAKKEK